MTPATGELLETANLPGEITNRAGPGKPRKA